MAVASSRRGLTRRGQALVEYVLLIAGVALVCVVAVAVLGHKSSDVVGVMASVIPGAHVEDNAPIASGHTIPTTLADGKVVLDSANLVNPAGVDRMKTILGAGGGENLIKD